MQSHVFVHIWIIHCYDDDIHWAFAYRTMFSFFHSFVFFFVRCRAFAILHNFFFRASKSISIFFNLRILPVVVRKHWHKPFSETIGAIWHQFSVEFCMKISFFFFCSKKHKKKKEQRLLLLLFQFRDVSPTLKHRT